MGCDRNQSRWTRDLDCAEEWLVWAFQSCAHHMLTSVADPRFDIGVPMLGCPSYRVLMKQRAEKNGLPWAPPHMPDSLLKLLGRIDPDSVDFQATGQSNPYYGKAVLVCHGDKDDLVPWTAGKAFVDGLQVGPSGAKRVFLEPGRGHETSSGMVEELSKWLAEHALRPRSATSSHGKSAL